MHSNHSNFSLVTGALPISANIRACLDNSSISGVKVSVTYFYCVSKKLKRIPSHRKIAFLFMSENSININGYGKPWAKLRCSIYEDSDFGSGIQKPKMVYFMRWALTYANGISSIFRNKNENFNAHVNKAVEPKIEHNHFNRHFNWGSNNE